MKFTFVEYLPIKADLNIDKIKNSFLNKARPGSIDEAGRIIIENKVKEIADLIEYENVYAETFRSFNENNVIYFNGLELKERHRMTSFDAFNSRLNPFQKIDYERNKFVQPIPVHFFILLSEKVIAISYATENIPIRSIESWTKKALSACGIPLATREIQNFIKRFISSEVEKFSEKMRNDNIATEYKITISDAVGKLSMDTTLTKSDGTKIYTDITKTLWAEKLKEEIDDINNRDILALDCHPTGFEQKFILIFSNLEGTTPPWQFKIKPYDNIHNLILSLKYTAKYFQKYRLSPPDPSSYSLEKFF